MVDDVVEGEPDDPAEGLGVERGDHCGDSGGQGEFVIGEQVAE